MFLRLLTTRSRVTSKVFVSVTIGIGDFIHSSNAWLRMVSCGFISDFPKIRNYHPIHD